MEASRSIGTTLIKTSGTPFTVGGLTSIGELGMERGEVDVTTLDSSNDFKEYLRTWKDGGEITISGYVKDTTSFASMYALVGDNTTHTWEITFPSGSKWFFAGFVKMFKEAESTVEGVRGFTGSIRITGAAVFAQTGVSA